jgi:hypothetical protein
VDVLLDQEDAEPVVGGGPHGGEEPVDDLGRQADGQLVDQQQPRLPGQAAGEGEHLLLAARQQPHPAVQVVLQLGEQLDGPTGVAPADPQVLGDGEVHEDGPLLGDDAEPPPGPHVERVAGGLAEEPDLAAQRGQLARQREQRRRLPGAVGPEQGDDLAGVDPQVEVADDLDAAVAGPQPHGLDQRRRRRSRRRRCVGRGHAGCSAEPR